MDSKNRRQIKTYRSKDALDRRFDQWIETGRQFVDGVSGTRPGRRKNKPTSFANAGLDGVGRWVGEKIDWILEEEDDWKESWELGPIPQTISSTGKRPLDAISRRVPRTIAPRSNRLQEEEDTACQEDFSDWPDESSFRIERWQRKSIDKSAISSPLVDRKVPKSTRRRYKNN